MNLKVHLTRHLKNTISVILLPHIYIKYNILKANNIPMQQKTTGLT